MAGFRSDMLAYITHVQDVIVGYRNRSNKLYYDKGKGFFRLPSILTDGRKTEKTLQVSTFERSSVEVIIHGVPTPKLALPESKVGVIPTLVCL